MHVDVYRFGQFRLIPAAHELWNGEQRVALPQRVLSCLCYLIEQRERAVERDELIRAVWRRDNVSDIQLGQLILRARRAVGDEGNAQHSIRTVVGYGYRWIAPIEVVTSPVLGSGDTAPAPAPVEPLAPSTVQSEQPIPARADRAPTLRRWFGGALALLCIAVGIVAFVARQRAVVPRADFVAPADARVAVMPLHVEGADDGQWLRLGGMDLVAERLRRGGLAVARSEAILTLLDAQPHEDAVAALDRLHRAAGTTLIIDGDLDHGADDWTIRLRARSAAAVDAAVEARGSDAVAVVRDASDRLLAALGRAPAANDAGPAAEFIQRARAALLADDPARASAILDAAPTALQSDPELRFYRAQSLARGGRFAEAEAALSDLLGAASATDNPRLRMRILGARGLARVRIGRLQEARQDYDAAIATAHAQDFAAEYGDALNGRAISEIALHDFDAGSADLGRARVQLERAGDALGIAHVDNNLGLLDYERGALAEAAVHIGSAAQRFEAFASARPLASAQSGLMLVQLAQLQNTAALATSARLWVGLEHTGDPIQRRALTLRRTSALLANGGLREAGHLLDGITTDPGPNLHDTRDDERLQLLRCELALREGRSADAAREAATLPTAPPASGDDDLRAMSALIRARALPHAEPAADDATQLALVEPTPTALPLRALVAAERALRAGQRETAEREFHKALSLAESVGVPSVIATIATAYAPVLIGEGRIDDAAALVGRVAVWAGDDFDCALLQLRLARAGDDAQAWARALSGVRKVAGERTIPPELTRAALAESR
jgi:DNA-binding winged helix-turn-helix (wHTH) protein/tetratricopeptide (TPR) repeat protein